jgi:uncharacterized protein
VAQQNIASAVGIKVKCGGQEVNERYLVSFMIEKDLGQPDMCSVTIRNEDSHYSGQIQVGNPLEIEAGDQNVNIFSGEVVALEPVYKANGENTVTVRAFNKLHRLLRGRKSKTFLDRSDKQIVEAIANEHNLSPQCGNATVVHKHVYQHNQTNLEFLRVRAARLGFDVWVDGDTLHFDQPNSGEDSGIKLRYGEAEESMKQGAIFLKHFAPRMSSTGVVKSVKVRGWNPEKKEEIIGEARAEASRLGTTSADSAAGSLASPETFEVDQPIFSKEEADLLAKAKLREAMMSYMTGEGECRGSPEIKPGIVVTITVNTNPSQTSDRFNGKYLITGVSHRYANPTRGDTGGYVTAFRVCRDAEGA